MLPRLKQLLEDWGSLLAVVFVACCIGIVVALAESLFFWGLQFSIALHQQYRLILTCLLPVFGALLVWMMQKVGGLSRKGMNLVFEVSQGLTPRIPKRTVSLVSLCTWISHIAGASVGREGVAVQIGATISDFFRNKIPIYKHAQTTFLVIGMAAGFAGLFGTPFTAAFFALEVMTAGKLELAALLPAMAAAFTAAKTSSYFGIHPEVFALTGEISLSNWLTDGKLILMGILFGLCGGLFAWLLHVAKHKAGELFEDPIRRIVILGIPTAVLILLLFQGRYSNTGSELMAAALENGDIMPWDFAGKMIITIASLSIGFVGGEVTPLFTMGACLGCTLGRWMGLDPSVCAALGYAAVFGAGTNTWLASIMIGMELFGYSYFPFFFVVCSIAYIINHNQSIYSMQRVLYEKDMQPLRIHFHRPQHSSE